MQAYIYLIQDGMDVGTTTYKPGRTIQKIGESISLKRLKSYSRGTVIYNIFIVPIAHMVEIEQKIIALFNSKYILVRGFEWFSGNVHEMKKDIDGIIDPYNSCTNFAIENRDEKNIPAETNHESESDDSSDEETYAIDLNKFVKIDTSNIALIERIHLHTQVPKEFIEDFIALYDSSNNPTAFCIDLDIIAKWLLCKKGVLLETLRYTYKQHFDFIETKPKLTKKRGGNLYISAFVTIHCAKQLLIRARARQSHTIHAYLIEIETMFQQNNNTVLQYKAIPNAGSMFIIRAKHRPSQNIIELLKNRETAHNEDVTVIAVYKTEYRKEVERCVKELVKEKQYKKRREIYEVDSEIIQKVITGCMKLSMKLHHKSRRDNPEDGQYYMIFTSDIPGRVPA